MTVYRAERLLMVLCLAFFLTAAFYQVELPALNYDEAFDAVPAMEMLQGIPVSAAYKVSLAGREIPLMLMSYKGAMTTYLALPFFWIMGVGVVSLRTVTIVVSALTLLLTFAWARSMFGRPVAALTLVLLATSPAFIFWSRTGAYVSSPMLLFSVASLLCLWEWQAGGRQWQLTMGGLLLGLGLSTKISFVWLPAAMLTAMVILGVPLRDTLALRIRRLPAGTVRFEAEAAMHRLIPFVLAFGLGAGPILVYNLTTQGTLQTILGNLSTTQLYGVSNADFVANLLVELRAFSQMLDGSFFGEEYKAAFSNALAIPLFIIAFSYLLWRSASRLVLPATRPDGPLLGVVREADSDVSGRRTAFVLILLVTILAESCFTVSNLGAIHLPILLPLPQLILALAICLFLKATQSARGQIGSVDWLRRSGRLLIACCAGLMVLLDVAVVVDLHNALGRTGGEGGNSDALYRLADYLRTQKIASPVALDWGFKKNIQILTENTVIPSEAFFYNQTPDPGLVETYKGYFSNPTNAYLLHSTEYTAFGGHAELLAQAAEETNRALHLARTFQQRDGRVVYLLYTVVDKPRVFVEPSIRTRQPNNLGNQISFLGYDLAEKPKTPDTSITVTLYWRALARMETSYTVFVHLVDDADRLWGQNDSLPAKGGRPTTSWSVGEYVADTHEIPVDSRAAAGSYRLVIGIYDLKTMQRLPVLAENGTPQADYVVLRENVALEGRQK